MKKIFLIILCLFSLNVYSQGNNLIEKPKVDERVELLSIVFRLADAKEYSSNRFKLYTEKIDSYFGKYKNHELIQFVKQIRSENGIGFDQVMEMAIHLGGAPKFKPLVKLTDSIPSVNWGKKNTEKFINLLNQFYQDAHCKEFFNDNKEFYASVSEKFQPVFENIDLDWYKSFYGVEPKEKFRIVNGLGNGDGNYGPDIVFKNGTREVYAIMGTWNVDSLGMAKFNLNDYFPTLIHEFNHSFINTIVEKNIKSFEKSGEKIYEVVGKQMGNQAYGDYKIMLYEALVRASVIKYMKDHKFEKAVIDNEFNEQLNRGFIWINELVKELEKYGNQRNKYPTLESYMSNIVNAYSNYANNIDSLKNNLNQKRPKVILINEFANGSQDVDADIKTITINFDRVMRDGYSFDKGLKGESFLPEVLNVEFDEARKKIILSIKLLKNKEYQFMVTITGSNP